MPITFDSIEALKEFCAEFITSAPAVTSTPPVVLALPQASLPVATLASTTDSVPPVQGPKKRGPKPKLKGVDAPIVPKVKPLLQQAKGPTVTARIKQAVDKQLAKKIEFTANSIYDQLAKQDDTLKKHTVVTSVLKLMSQVYSDVPTELRPSTGPRPIKVYLPA
jgi:hypothetical protein